MIIMVNTGVIVYPTMVVAVYLMMEDSIPDLSKNKHVAYYKIGCEICSVVPEHLPDEGS